MKKVVTHSATIHAANRDASAPRPRKTTIDFLKQFARSYHFEPGVNQAIGGMIVN